MRSAREDDTNAQKASTDLPRLLQIVSAITVILAHKDPTRLFIEVQNVVQRSKAMGRTIEPIVEQTCVFVLLKIRDSTW